MDLTRASHIAQILSLLPGSYCAYAAWVASHPPSITPANAAAAGVGILGSSTLIAFGAFVALLALGALLAALSWSHGPQLKIRSAVYGTGPVNDIDVTKLLQKQGRKALVAVITNELFGRDPAPNLPKRLQVEYQYGIHSAKVVSRPEHSRLVLPEDSWLRDEVVRLTELVSVRTAERDKEIDDAADLRKQVEQLRDGRTLAQQASLHQRELPPSAPQLLVEYRDPGLSEKLVIHNDGPGNLRGLEIGKLTLGYTKTLEFGILNAIGVLRTGQSMTLNFTVAEVQGTTHIVQPLYGWIRQALKEAHPGEPQVTVRMVYEDMDGKRFSRDFTLSIDPLNQIVFDPEPVRFEPSTSEATR